MDFFYIDCEKQKEIAAQNTVFAVPTILVFFEGKENIRKSRNIGIEQLKSEIKRIYELMFD
jgi:Tfp pilus assembly PilM family ATPase